jgi:formylglycine-generating enzyme required for sulfatase activity
MTSEENENPLIINHSGGLIRRMDNQLELMNRVLGEISERKSEIIPAASSFMGSRAGEERDWEIAPDVKMTFCWCPPGEFLMGSPKAAEEQLCDEDQVEVKLTKGYWMGKTQVTQAQWFAIMEKNPSKFRGDELPVERVNWFATQDFLIKINQFVGHTDKGQMVLPTEAQWEYACLAGNKGLYSGGTIHEVAWYDKNSEGQTHPVGLKNPNIWGLFDMHGNVWEWCADHHEERLPGGVDPCVSNTDECPVYKGGGWYSDEFFCLAARRSYSAPAHCSCGLGFRVARISIP